MKLIGMLDSPYVRRVAISLQLLGLRFEHQSLSVFSTFAAFRQINPVVKAPTFLCAIRQAGQRLCCQTLGLLKRSHSRLTNVRNSVLFSLL